MENQQIAEVIKKFDNFVQFSISRKEEPEEVAPVADSKVDSYLREMEKRLKLRPRSQEQKFEKLLKPMKSLKSFVSVKEFMENLGECAVGRVGERVVERQDKALKVSYQKARGGYYMERIEQHLRSKNFKRSSRKHPFYVTELDDHSLETSEYRSWIENTLSKITPKNDQFFKKNQVKIKEAQPQAEESRQPRERDCLIEEHQKEYADQFKVVPRMRQLCNQEYESFAKISSLLTGRLRKILKNHGTGKKQPIFMKGGAYMQNFEKCDDHDRSKLRRTARGNYNKENPTTSRKTANKKRVQTAGPQRRDQSDGWRDMVSNKLKDIITHTGPSLPQPPNVLPTRLSAVQE